MSSAYPPATAPKGQVHSALPLPKPLHLSASLLALEEPRWQLGRLVHHHLLRRLRLRVLGPSGNPSPPGDPFAFKYVS